MPLFVNKPKMDTNFMHFGGEQHEQEVHYGTLDDPVTVDMGEAKYVHGDSYIEETGLAKSACLFVITDHGNNKYRIAHLNTSDKVDALDTLRLGSVNQTIVVCTVNFEPIKVKDIYLKMGLQHKNRGSLAWRFGHTTEEGGYGLYGDYNY